MINFGIPHIAENIFERFGTRDLINCRKVSRTWEAFAEKILQKRLEQWRGKMDLACRCGDIDAVELLLEYSETEGQELNIGASGYTAFGSAILSGHKRLVRFLLSHPYGKNIDLNARHGHNGCTKLMDIIIKDQFNCDFMGMAKLLLFGPLRANIDINARDKYGWTALTWACFIGNRRMVKLLLDCPGIDVNRTGGRMSPLVVACQQGNKDVVELLLQYPEIRKTRMQDHFQNTFSPEMKALLRKRLFSQPTKDSEKTLQVIDRENDLTCPKSKKLKVGDIHCVVSSSTFGYLFIEN